MQQKKSNTEDSMVRKMMLTGWNESIFVDIKQRLQDSAMKLVLQVPLTLILYIVPVVVKKLNLIIQDKILRGTML